MSAMLPIAAIRLDGGTQPRSKIDEAVVAEYAAAMRDGATFPPVVVFHDGVDTWLADGFHRVHAARQSGAAEIAVDRHTGTKRDAILHSLNANVAHGAQITVDDKRRAALIMLNDQEWSRWSDTEIARHCGWRQQRIGELRRSLTGPVSEKMFTNKHGTVSTMRTENIGKRVSQEPVDQPPATQPVQRPAVQSRGVGLAYAHKAIEFLQQIPLNDAMRDDALDTVVQWITDNR